MTETRALPPPSPNGASVVVDAPGDGSGYWAGSPSALRTEDGVYWLAYRLRRPRGVGRGYANVVARSEDGLSFETLVVLRREEFDCDSLERPALIQRTDGSWRLYVSCATTGTDHWRVEALDAADPSGFTARSTRTVLPGSPASVGVKDPVVKLLDERWHLWLCCHPLDVPGATDRMWTEYGTSADGLQWTMHGTALAGTEGRWDQRGSRVADVICRDGTWLAYYDGRASKDENGEERTGTAAGTEPGRLAATGGPVGAGAGGAWSLRYTSAVVFPDGGLRLYYETRRLDGAHDLRTEYVPPPDWPIGSGPTRSLPV